MGGPHTDMEMLKMGKMRYMYHLKLRRREWGWGIFKGKEYNLPKERKRLNVW